MRHGFGLSGLLFCLAGLVSVFSEADDIGMMFIAIGMMFTTLASTS